MNTTALGAYLESPKAAQALALLYGTERILAQKERYHLLLQRHRAFFGERERVCFCSAPGRSEIAGNHTDHNNGRVLAAAVHLDTVAAVSPAEGNLVRLYSDGYEQPFVVDLGDLAVRPEEAGTSSALIRGVAAGFKDRGLPVGGFDAVVTSTVGKGSGLSSSAAFEVMLCEVLNALYGQEKLDEQERARISQYAENVFFGKPSGLLDQMASSVGGLVTMDFGRSPVAIEALSFDFEAQGYALVVVAAGGDHGELTDEYAAIPREMRQVAGLLGGKVLREIPRERMEEAIPRIKNRVSDRAILRALHFYDEDARIPGLVHALKQEDLKAFLAGIIASGQSSWTLLQNLFVPGRENHQELVLAMELSRRMLKDRGGAWRVHGGGFAGTILAFVPLSLVPDYAARMNAVFGEEACTVLRVRPVGPCTLPES